MTAGFTAFLCSSFSIFPLSSLSVFFHLITPQRHPALNMSVWRWPVVLWRNWVSGLLALLQMKKK